MKGFLIITLPLFLLTACQSIVTLENGAKAYADTIDTFSLTDTAGILVEGFNFTFAEEYKDKDGKIYKKGSRYSKNSRDGISFYLAKEWTDPVGGFVIKPDTEVIVDINGHYRQFILARDWKEKENGRVFKAGSMVKISVNGNIYIFTLAENWRSPKNGMVLKAGVLMNIPDPIGDENLEKYQLVFKYKNSVMVLAEDWIEPERRYVIAANEKITLQARGLFHTFLLAKDWEYPQTGMVFKGGTKVTLFSNSIPSAFTLAKDYITPKDRIPIKADYEVTMYENGNIEQCTLAKNFEIRNSGLILKGETILTFREDGKIAKATLAQPWKDPGTGKQYQADIEYTFYF